MDKPIDLTGQTFGRLTVIRRSPRRIPATGKTARERGWTLPLWECICQCGIVVYRTTIKLRSPGLHSCGCAQRDLASAAGILATSHATVKICRACEKSYYGTRKQRYCCRTCKEADAIHSPLSPAQRTAAAKNLNAWKSARALTDLLTTQEAIRARSAATD